MRLFLLALLLFPSLAMAQVDGISLAFKHDAPVTRQANHSGQLSVGKDVVAVFPDETVNRLKLFKFDGSEAPTPEVISVNSVAFAGEHLYIANVDGLHVFDKSGEKVQSLSQGRLKEVSMLQATPDGTTIFVMHHFAPASITVYARDTKTGKLTQTQVFQTDEAGLAVARLSGLRKPIVIDKTAVRVPKFDGAESAFTDGKRLFMACGASNSIVLFAKSAGGWRHVQSLAENNQGREKNGLMMCRSVAVNAAGDVFVGGTLRLNWLRLAGERLEAVKWWADDSNVVAHPESAALSFLDHAHSLAFSKNGKYLFVGSTSIGGVAVCRVGEDLEIVGEVNDSPSGAKMLDVAVSPDGTKLFCKTTKCHLLIYDLDKTFTE